MKSPTREPAKPGLAYLLRKFESIGSEIAQVDRQRLESLLPAESKLVPPGVEIRNTETHCALLAEGFAARTMILRDGRRQIVTLHLPGDILNLEALFLDRLDYRVEIMVPSRVVALPRDELSEVFETEPSLRRLFMRDMLITGSIFRQWIVNAGRRRALPRMAHLFCEQITRCRAIGLTCDNHQSCPFPLTQDSLGDATGLTIVHVNRTLRTLRERELAVLEKRTLIVKNWDGLVALAEFDPGYLHQD